MQIITIPQPKQVSLIQNKIGSISISRSAMYDLIIGCTRCIIEIKSIRSRIRIEDQGIYIVVFCQMKPGSDLERITAMVESSVIACFKKCCEIDIKEVKVLPKPKGFLDALLK